MLVKLDASATVLVHIYEAKEFKQKNNTPPLLIDRLINQMVYQGKHLYFATCSIDVV
jgi:hypothetical protein